MAEWAHTPGEGGAGGAPPPAYKGRGRQGGGPGGRGGNVDRKLVLSKFGGFLEAYDAIKGIVVGHGGAMIKKIGTQARVDIERLLGCKVFLSLEVRVRPQWRRDVNVIRRLGYDAGE